MTDWDYIRPDGHNPSHGVKPTPRGWGPAVEEGEMTVDLVARLPEMERQADEHERAARALRQIVAGVRALNGHAAEITEPRFVEQNGTVFVAQAQDARGPRGREAILRVMSEDPRRTWKVIELKREILARGWAPSPKAVEANLKRMRELGDVECPRYAYYRLAAAMSGGDRTDEPTNIQSGDGEARQ
jgi:hypothetical protein